MGWRGVIRDIPTLPTAIVQCSRASSASDCCGTGVASESATAVTFGAPVTCSDVAGVAVEVPETVPEGFDDELGAVLDGFPDDEL
jgi:hypothetical protein